ncbi:MAG TPA: M56 family metallopeptidase [Vicinamibacterales bacterium]|nr:M56 family metallopeptidase [Vicinamibacterales bacterium]
MDLELILRTSAVLIVAALIATSLRRAAPSTRHLVWQLAIIAVLAAPILAPLVPAITVPGVPQVPHVPEAVFGRSSTVPNAIFNAATTARPETLGTPQNNAVGTFGTLGTLGTLAVASWFLLCWVLSGLSVWRGSTAAPKAWVNDARMLAARIGLKRPIAVRQLRRDATPHVAGFFRSVVMMPPSAASWTIQARHAALVHELTHIKRRDRTTQALAQLACAIYWFNPLVWHAAAGLARERERACDDAVLKFGARPSDYATLLLDLARSKSAWTPATALSMARPSAIEGRLLSILADAVRTPRRSTRWVVSTAIVALTTAILGAQAAQPAALPLPAPAPRAIVKPQMVMALDQGTADASILGTLVDAMKDQDRSVREHAAMGLAVTPGAEVIDPLLSALQDPDAQVREKAAIGLVFRRDPRIVDALLAAIKDGDAQVREKAAIALGASGDARAIAALTAATKDPDAQVREKAVTGLVLLGFIK